MLTFLTPLRRQRIPLGVPPPSLAVVGPQLYPVDQEPVGNPREFKFRCVSCERTFTRLRANGSPCSFGTCTAAYHQLFPGTEVTVESQRWFVQNCFDSPALLAGRPFPPTEGGSVCSTLSLLRPSIHVLGNPTLVPLLHLSLLARLNFTIGGGESMWSCDWPRLGIRPTRGRRLCGRPGSLRRDSDEIEYSSYVGWEVESHLDSACRLVDPEWVWSAASATRPKIYDSLSGWVLGSLLHL